MQQLDPHRVPWFADVAPSLLTNRTIRNYLAGYSEQSWPQVVKMTILYGIVCLQQQHSGQTLTLQQLKEVAQAAATNAVVQRNVPALQRQILQMQTDLDKVFDKLTVEPFDGHDNTRQGADQQSCGATGPARQQGQSAPLLQIAKQRVLGSVPAVPQQPARRVVCRNVIAARPSDVWRAGSPSGWTSPACAHPLRRSHDNQGATNPIYPDWWLSGPQQRPQASQQQQVSSQQPRLAYSLSQRPQQPITVDDLITPTFLVVSSSGYGQQAPAPGVAGQGPNITASQITADGITTTALQTYTQLQQEDARQRQEQQVQQQQQASRGSQLQPVRRRGVSQVESRIKQAMAASRQKAARHTQQREQLLETAVSGRTTVDGDTGQGSDQSTVDAVDCPAAAAAQFISNPWTSWFVPGAAPDITALAATPMQLGTPLAEQAQDISSGSSTSGTSSSRPSAAAPPSTLMGLRGAQESLGGRALQDITHTAALNQHEASSSNTSNSHRVQMEVASEAAATQLVLVGQQEHCNLTKHDRSSPWVLQQPAHRSQHQSHSHHRASGERQPWAFDFGHLDAPELDKAATAAAASTAQVQPGGTKHRQLWSEKWVGNFGHLEWPRFSTQSAFSHHQLQHMGQVVGPHSPGSPGLLMSPSQLQQLVDAGAHLSGLTKEHGDKDPRQQQEASSPAHQQLQHETAHFNPTAATLQAQSACGAEDVVAGIIAGGDNVSSTAAAKRIAPGWLEALLLRDVDPFTTASGPKAAAVVEAELPLCEDDAARHCSPQESGFEADGGDTSSLTGTTNPLQQAIARHGNMMQLINGL